MTTTASTILCRTSLAALVAALWFCLPTTAFAQVDCSALGPSTGRAPAECAPAAKDATATPLAPALANPAYGPNNVANELVFHDLATPEVLTTVGPYSPPGFSNACDFNFTDTETLYCIDSGGLFHTVDINTGVRTDLGTVATANQTTGMSFDPTSGDFFAVTVPGGCGGGSTLISVDFDAVTASVIGAIPTMGCAIGIGINNAGQMFGYDIVDDNLHSINKSTGASSVVGPLGFNANFGQGMDFDSSDDTCYLWAFNLTTFQPELRTCNTSTGATTLLGVLGSTTPGSLAQMGTAGVAVFTPPQIDLSLDKDVDFFDEDSGRVIWVITVENDSDDDEDATGVVVRDDFPAATLVDDFDASQGTFDPLTGLWDVGALADGASATLTIEADLNAQGEFLNCAEVIAANEDDADSSPDDGVGDDADCTLVFIGPRRDGTEFERGLGPGRLIDRGGRRFASDLSLTKEVDDETVSVGEEITYTIAVTNSGPQTNAGIVVEDVLPECLDFVSASASQGSYSTSTGEWVLGGQLRVGQTATLEITVTVGDDCEGEVTNTAEITETNLPDPDRFFVDPFDPDRPQPDETDSASITVSGASSRVAALLEAYPNPFNPQTVIPFELKEAAEVELAVYDLLGRQVQVLVRGQLDAGRHQATFRAGQLPTGMYLVRLSAGGTVQTQRITLLK